MIDRRIGKIKVRRGTDSQRVTNTFEEGEVIYSVDKKRIFVGDDVTLGGVPVSNRNYIVNSLGNSLTVPVGVLEGDIIHNKSNSKTYIVNSNNGTLELLLIANKNESFSVKDKISDIYNKLRTLTGCLTPETPPTLPPSKLNWVIQPSDFFINIGDTATFSSSAVGSGNITYEWKRKDALTINTSNIYQKSFTINSVGIPDIATYYCIASNSIDSITSREAVLDIGSDSILAEDGTYVLSELSEFINWEYKVVAPIITKQPVSVATTVGTSVTFSIEAIGTDPLTYQWKFAGADIAGETKTTYTITNPTVDINSIACKVSNIGGDVLSDSVNLTIIESFIKIKNIFSDFLFFSRSFFVGMDGTVFACGRNDKSQLGDGTTTEKLTSVKINLPPVSMIAGGDHTLFLGKDGTVSACGSNTTGELGDGTTTNRFTPVKIDLPPVSMITGSEFYSLFLGTDGTVSGCGYNGYGNLGTGTAILSTTLVKVNLPPVSMIDAGYQYSIFLGTDGTVSACGRNFYGQLGDGSVTSQFEYKATPVKVNLPPVSMIAAGHLHSIYLGTDGTVSACGRNDKGQLGDGTTTDKSTPIKINLPPVSMIAGGDHTLFLGTDGTVSACGANGSGQLGDGTTTNRSTLIKINLPPVSMIAAGHTHSVFLGTDGTVSACGSNSYGQLGDGTTSNRSTPVLITIK